MTYFEKGRVDFEIFRDDVETEEMAIDALAAHGVLITDLVLLAGRPQQLDSIRALSNVIGNKRWIECTGLIFYISYN